jgi:hypothetical protein
MKYDKLIVLRFKDIKWDDIRGMIAVIFRMSYIAKLEEFRTQYCLQRVKKSKTKYVHELSAA